MLRTILYIATTLLLITGFTFFTNNVNTENPLPPSAIFYAKEGNPDWLKIKDGVQVTADEIVARHRAELGLGMGDELVLYRTDHDGLGFAHYRYQQYYQGIKVQGSQLLVHEKNGLVQTLNGKLARRLNAKTEPVISGEEAVKMHWPTCLPTAICGKAKRRRSC